MRRFLYRFLCFVLLLAVSSIAWIGGSDAAHGHKIKVTSTDDANGACLVKSYCTLRSAIALAQPGDKIVIPAGYFHLTINSPLAINEKLTLVGAGASNTQIVGNGVAQSAFTSSVFSFGPSANATLRGLTVSGGNAVGTGGGIRNSSGGTVTLISDTISNNVSANEGGGIANEGSSTMKISKSLITDNQAPSGAGIENAGTATLNMTKSSVVGNYDTIANGAGGGVLNDATAVITKTTIANNTAGLSAGGGGGGLFGSGGTLTMLQSTVSGNHAADGAGFYLQVGTSDIENSTISGNNASNQSGGGFEVLGNTLTLTRDTIAKNSAPIEGGGIQAGSGTTFLSASIVGENTATSDPDCWSTNSGTLVSHDFNVVQTVNATDCHLTAGPHDNFNQNDPNLGALAFNGGPTETMAIPKNGSVAVRLDKADPTCNGHVKDQRGRRRPKHKCDSGAFQVTK